MHKTSARRWSSAFSAVALVIATSAVAHEVPRFEVDPFWPKPLPNNWALGQVAGVAVDERDHVWIIQRPTSLARNEKLAAAKPPAAKCCVPAPPVIEFDPEGNVVQAWGGPGIGLRLAQAGTRHPRRPPGFRLVRRQPSRRRLRVEIHAATASS